MEWLCSDHWKFVPRDLKRLRNALLRRLNRRWGKLAAQRDLCPANTRARFILNRRLQKMSEIWVHTENRIWERMKQAAIDRATGI